MAFMTLRTIGFQNKKEQFLTSQFCSFYCLFFILSRSLHCCQRKVSESLLSQNLMFLKNSLRFYWLPHWFFTKKNKFVFDFVMFYDLFVDIRYILDNCSSQMFFLEINEPT